MCGTVTRNAVSELFTVFAIAFYVFQLSVTETNDGLKEGKISGCDEFSHQIINLEFNYYVQVKIVVNLSPLLHLFICK